MEKRSNSEQEVLGQVVERLFSAREEIDQLAKLLASEKGLPSEEFEKIKDAFRERLAALQQLIPGGQEGEALRLAVEDLKENLSTGVARDRSSFIQQKKNILFSLSVVGKNSLSIRNGNLLELEHEAEKLKLKLEILFLKFTIGKLVIGKTFDQKLHQASAKIGEFRDGLSSLVTKGEDGITHARKKSAEIYKHLKKSITTLVH